MAPNGPAPFSVGIVSSFDRDYQVMWDSMPDSRKRNWNQELPVGARAIFIGGSGNYNLFVQEVGVTQQSGEITPYIQIAGGVVHPISPYKIINEIVINRPSPHSDVRFENDAPNIIVLY